MALIIEAPKEIYSIQNKHNLKVFLAGGISNCPNWQEEMIDLIDRYYYDNELTIYNPRRKKFPMDDPNAAEEQITWEYEHLKEADIIIFWFSRGSLNPIVLYELGQWGNSGNKPIIIGIDPEYERAQDVIIQTSLSRCDVPIVNSLKEVVKNLRIIIDENKKIRMA